MFAAASLKNAIDDIAARYETDTGDRVTLVYAGTAVLARQIEQGAPAHVFVSANPEWMEYLEQRELIAPDSLRVLVGNRLVLIGPAGEGGKRVFDENLDLDALLAGGRLAMALVDAVPAGSYGKAALTHFDLWDDVAPNVAQADNVRAALAYVALGQMPLGIVYASDALAEPRVAVLADIPAESHPPIRYPAALVAGNASSRAEAFLSFISGPAAAGLFEKHGFTVPGE